MSQKDHNPFTRRRLLLGFGGALIAGCTGGGSPPADPAGQPVAFDTPGLMIRGRYHPPEAGAVSRHLWVVIEGDGAVWHQGQPPRDPTPRRAAGPSVIASLPPGEARLWLARPCQYLSPAALATCNRRYWTDARFSAPVLAAYQKIIDHYATGLPVVLIGFSGGGIVAAELALSRTDAAGLITLAAPLDLEAWTAYHGVPSLAGPRPSARFLRDLAHLDIPSIHLFGGSDMVVPPAMLPRTRATLPKDRVQMVPGMRHSDDWAGVLMSRLDAVISPG